VLLAARTPAGAQERVLDLGCGVGAAALCLARRTGAQVTGLELQGRYAALARENAQINALPFQVIEGDLQNMPADLRAQTFDHVIANPPYYDRARGTQSSDAGREAALGEAAPLRAWVDAGVRRLKPKGRLHIILKAERLPELLGACDTRLGDLEVLPIAARAGRPAELVILGARKGARGPFRLHPPLILHEGAAHDGGHDRHFNRSFTS
jgi:tRNA1(Val) A37 N6-methylase TrmN6